MCKYYCIKFNLETNYEFFGALAAEILPFYFPQNNGDLDAVIELLDCKTDTPVFKYLAGNLGSYEEFCPVTLEDIEVDEDLTEQIYRMDGTKIWDGHSNWSLHGYAAPYLTTEEEFKNMIQSLWEFIIDKTLTIPNLDMCGSSFMVWADEDCVDLARAINYVLVNPEKRARIIQAAVNETFNKDCFVLNTEFNLDDKVNRIDITSMLASLSEYDLTKRKM